MAPVPRPRARPSKAAAESSSRPGTADPLPAFRSLAAAGRAAMDWHPSFVLRQCDSADREGMYANFVSDLAHLRERGT